MWQHPPAGVVVVLFFLLILAFWGAMLGLRECGTYGPPRRRLPPVLGPGLRLEVGGTARPRW